MLELVKVGRDVYCGRTKLVRVDQAKKGPGKEVIRIEGLKDANGAKWISLSKLHDGLNKLEPKAREVTSTGSYTLTADEKKRVDELQKEIDEIKATARARYVPKPKFSDPRLMTPEEREAEAVKAEAYLKTLRQKGAY